MPEQGTRAEPRFSVSDDRHTGYATRNVAPLTPADVVDLSALLAQLRSPSVRHALTLPHRGECE